MKTFTVFVLTSLELLVHGSILQRVIYHKVGHKSQHTCILIVITTIINLSDTIKET